MLDQVFLGDRQHAASARCRVIQVAHYAGVSQHIVVFDKDQVDHQADHFTGGEVLPGGFVGDLREFADQLLEHQAHLHVVYRFRVQIDLCEAFCHLESPWVSWRPQLLRR
ncbi:hypothetical protein D9M68_797220 [compost metagenome]